jgi:hypothetical protein
MERAAMIWLTKELLTPNTMPGTEVSRRVFFFFFPNVVAVIVVFKKMRSYYVAQTGPELPASGDLPVPAS